jgi:hypothetical protein
VVRWSCCVAVHDIGLRVRVIHPAACGVGIRGDIGVLVVRWSCVAVRSIDLRVRLRVRVVCVVPTTSSITVETMFHFLPLSLPLRIWIHLTIPSISKLGSLIRRWSVHTESLLRFETTALSLFRRCGDWVRRGQGFERRADTFSFPILSPTINSLTSMNSMSSIASITDLGLVFRPHTHTLTHPHNQLPARRQKMRIRPNARWIEKAIPARFSDNSVYGFVSGDDACAQCMFGQCFASIHIQSN